jgi:hypothetical protein
MRSLESLVRWAQTWSSEILQLQHYSLGGIQPELVKVYVSSNNGGFIRLLKIKQD